MVKIDSKSEKVYVFLFTCSNICNVNLEIVNDLSTDQFLHTFSLNCAVYGMPSLIFCYNAETLLRWDEEIKLFQVKEDQKIQHLFIHLSLTRVLT